MLEKECTPREEEIIKLLTDGLSNIEIAGHLSISEDTVKVHIKHILNKLNLKNRGQVIAYYFKKKLEIENK